MAQPMLRRRVLPEGVRHLIRAQAAIGLSRDHEAELSLIPSLPPAIADDQPETERK